MAKKTSGSSSPRSERTEAEPHPGIEDLTVPQGADWRTALGRFGDELRRVYGTKLRGVFLYGSHARGDATPESDIDTLVLLEPFRDFWEEFDRISPLASRVSLDHDVVISAMPVDAERFPSDERSVIVNARREGRLIT